jgi:hypothetical protein
VHAIAQVPQWLASEGTHEPLHSSVPAGQRHCPPWQVRPAPQGMPQLPQLLESLEVSTHWAPQGVCEGEEQVMLPPVPPPPGAPPVPGLLGDGLLHAVARRATQKPRIGMLGIFMSPPQFPTRPDVISYTEVCVAPC